MTSTSNWIPVDAIERTEVVRPADRPPFTASDALGGVVNIITKKGGDKPTQAKRPCL